MGRKKDKDNFLEMMDKLQDLMRNMSEEELTEFGKLMTGESLMDDSINSQFYWYKRPDYEKDALREIRWLGPFWNAQDNDDKIELCKFVDKEWAQLPLEGKKAEVRGYMNALFYRFSPEQQDNYYKLFGALWMMEQYQMTDCIDLVLETLRQDAHFFTHFLTGMEDAMTALIYQIGNEQTDLLEKFLYEQGLIPQVKPIVFKAIVLTLLKQPRQRLKIVSLLSKFLKHCLEICQKGASPFNIEQYAIILAYGHVTELKPLIRTLYKKLRIKNIEMGGLSDIEELMDDVFEPFNCEHDNLTAYLEELAEEENNYAFPYYDEDENWDDLVEENIYYAVDDSCKRYILRLELMDGQEMVERTVQVPSNMYLETFAELIMTAFGRSDVPNDYWFEANNIRYTLYPDDYRSDDETFEIDSTYEVTIGAILSKKGNIAHYNIRDKNGKVKWRHAIVLEKSGQYTYKTQHFLELIDGRGAYPSKNTKDMPDFLSRIKEGKVKEPDFKSIRKKIEKLETETGSPCR